MASTPGKGEAQHKGSILLNLSCSCLASYKSPDLWTRRGYVRAMAHRGSPSLRQPWTEPFVPPLGALALYVFSSSAFKGHVKAAVSVERTSEGDCRGEPSNNHESPHRWAEAPSHPISHQHPQQRRGKAPASPVSSAFPPPFISFGFSPLIKLLACRNV